MSKGLMVFENNNFGPIRVMEINGEPWFVGKDIAEVLGYRNASKAIADHVEDSDKTDGVTIRDSMGREQNPMLINESGLYSLIFSSKLPTAREFKKWVTSEVLPSIRKNGVYILSQEEMTDEERLATALIAANRVIGEKEKRIKELTKQISEQEEVIEEMRPKADYFDRLVERKMLTGIRQTAKELHMGQEEFVDFLIINKFCCRDKTNNLIPYMNYVNVYFEFRETKNNKIRWTELMITPKGKEAFRLLTSNFNLDNDEENTTEMCE